MLTANLDVSDGLLNSVTRIVEEVEVETMPSNRFCCTLTEKM